MKFFTTATAFLVLGLAGSTLSLPTGQPGVAARMEDLEARAKPTGKATDAAFTTLLAHAQGTRTGKTGSIGVGAAGLASDGSIITGHSKGKGVHAEDVVIAKAAASGKTLTHILPFGNNRNQPKTADKVVPPCRGSCEDKLSNLGITSLGSKEASAFNTAKGFPTSLESAGKQPSGSEFEPDSSEEDSP